MKSCGVGESLGCCGPAWCSSRELCTGISAVLKVVDVFGAIGSESKEEHTHLQRIRVLFLGCWHFVVGG